MRSLIAAALVAALPLTAHAGKAVTYSVDGMEYQGYLAQPMEGSKGLVLIVHDWDGLTAYEEQRAEMIADLGYDAFAVDLFGKGERPTETSAKREATSALYDDREKMRRLLMGGLERARQ